MRDKDSTPLSLYLFAGFAEDALQRCNDDKATIKSLHGSP